MDEETEKLMGADSFSDEQVSEWLDRAQSYAEHCASLEADGLVRAAMHRISQVAFYEGLREGARLVRIGCDIPDGWGPYWEEEDEDE